MFRKIEKCPIFTPFNLFKGDEALVAAEIIKCPTVSKKLGGFHIQYCRFFN